MRIRIFGSGVAGLWLGKELAGRGVTVDIFEPNNQVGLTASQHGQGRIHDGSMYIILPSEYHFPQLTSEGIWQSKEILEKYVQEAVPEAISSRRTCYFFSDAEALNDARSKLFAAGERQFDWSSDARTVSRTASYLFGKKVHGLFTNEMSFNQSALLRRIKHDFLDLGGKIHQLNEPLGQASKTFLDRAWDKKRYAYTVFCCGAANLRLASKLFHWPEPRSKCFSVLFEGYDRAITEVLSTRLGEPNFPHISLVPQAFGTYTISSGRTVSSDDREAEEQSEYLEDFCEKIREVFGNHVFPRSKLRCRLVEKSQLPSKLTNSDLQLSISHPPEKFGDRYFYWLNSRNRPEILFHSVGKWTLAPLASKELAQTLLG